MTFFLDAILLAIIVMFIVFGSKKGFVKAFLDSCSTLIAGLLAHSLVDSAAKFAYDSFVRNLLRNRLVNTYTSSFTEYNTIQEKVEGLVDKVPESALNISAKMGVNVDTITNAIIEAKPTEQDVVIDAIMVNIVDKVIMPVVEVGTLIVLFIAFLLILAVLTRLIKGFVEKMPAIRGLDKFLGAGFGLLKGVIVVLVVCAVISFMVASSSNPEFVEMASASKILPFINERNPLLIILGQ